MWLVWGDSGVYVLHIRLLSESARTCTRGVEHGGELGMAIRAVHIKTTIIPS